MSKTSIEKLIKEIKDYFNNRLDEDYMKYNDHELSSIECLMDPDCDAPWDTGVSKTKESR
tara:strand:- start:23 stop:202 length:180 start_codon:yes stop_codon:yes gene_type:complete